MKKSLLAKVIIIILVVAIILRDNPYISLYRYVYLYNKNEYEKIIKLYNNDFNKVVKNDEIIINILKNKRENDGVIYFNHLIKSNRLLKSKNILVKPIVYEFKPKRNDVLVLRKNSKTNKWEVQFPYKLNKVQKVDSKASKPVSLKKKDTKTDIEEFFREFNKIYIKAILDKNLDGIKKLVYADNFNDFNNEFTTWYIENKDIISANGSMDIRDFEIISKDTVRASILEVVYLTNEEMEGSNTYNQDYKITIVWDYKIKRNNTNWIILNRQISQSIISYKDDNDEWVSYN